MTFLESAEAARARPGYRLAGVLVGGLLAVAAYTLPWGAEAPLAVRAAAALTVLMATWWLGGVLPMAVTALVPLVALPLLGLADLRDAAAPYADPLNALMLGGFVLAHAMEEVGLHRRVVAALLAPAWVRLSPQRVALALMTAAALVSSFVNNTAAMLMMLPTAMGLAVAAGNGARTRSAFALVTAYACSIGGVGTLVGTAPNAVLAGLAPRLAGREITFLGWLGVGGTFVLLAIPAAWWVVARWALPLPRKAEHPIDAPPRAPWTRDQFVVLGVVTACLLGWLTRAPVDLGAVTIPGWGPLLPKKIDDSFVAMAGALVLFLFPRAHVRDAVPNVAQDGVVGEALRRGTPPRLAASAASSGERGEDASAEGGAEPGSASTGPRPRRSPSQGDREGEPPPPQESPTPSAPNTSASDDADEARFLLSWRRASRAIPWSVLVLMGGGFALADCIQDSGLSGRLAGSVAGLATLPPAVQVFAVCVAIAFLSAFTSNTATTQLSLPILGAGATAAGIDPLLWMVPATISASCDFSMAVGTPPNAIATEAGEVRPADMFRAGVVLNVVCAAIATLVALTVGRAL